MRGRLTGEKLAHGRFVNFSEVKAFQDPIPNVTPVPSAQSGSGLLPQATLEGSLSPGGGWDSKLEKERKSQAHTICPIFPTISVPLI